MTTATFIFQALFPDPKPQAGEPEGTSLVVFDVEYEGRLLSHQIARLHPTKDGIVVSHEDLPFTCPDFSAAVEAYHRLMAESHGKTLSPSGPKGLRLRDNVFRAEWAIRLPVTPLEK